ncbi:MAG: 16S rRNA (cytidine(1402)-2'-O)-methyltransferase [Elusimicrobiales bacterium]|nr:16S rRNA (cytidine(1402)-2'-O)-methyltransferase [Elusimicrobiales bacterium]
MLHIVATPLGNLEDLSPRAARVLREADIVLCEDTRRTLALLRHIGSPARAERYNEHDENSLARAVSAAMGTRKAALVCDGGTPCVSDPGWKLVAEAVKAGIRVESVPGPCAAAAVFAASGFPSGAFVFLGFLPRKKSKIEKAVRGAAAFGKPFIIYESPFRIKKLLETLARVLGPQTRVALCREMTKIHEEWLRCTAEEALKSLASRSKVLGEITLVADPRGCAAPEPDGDEDEDADN